MRVSVFEGPVDAKSFPRRRVRFQERWPDLAAFLADLRAGEPGALEIGVELASHLDPDGVVPILHALLEAGPWRTLGSALGRALGRTTTEEGFRVLLAHRRLAYVDSGLGGCGWAGGVELAWAELARHGDLDRSELEPRDRDDVKALLRYLSRFDPRGRTIIEDRFRGAAANGLRHWAGVHLLGIGDPAALELLASATDDPTHRSAAVRAILRRDATTAVDALGGLEHLCSAAGRERADVLLHEVAADAKDRRIGRGGHGWIAQDPRFVALATAWKRDRATKGNATYLLSEAPPEQVAAAKKADRRPPLRPKRTVAEPDEALVAEMTRAREALERIVGQLKSAGYRFESKRPLRPPTAASRKAAARIGKEAGPVPLALRAFWDVVGGVDLRGRHPSWPEGWHTDPLVVAPPDALLEEVLDEAAPDVPLGLAFAPDLLGKAGFSAGALSIWLPSEGRDPVVEGGPAAETFLAHLARALRWGGLPGFEAIADRPEAFLEALLRAAGPRANRA